MSKKNIMTYVYNTICKYLQNIIIILVILNKNIDCMFDLHFFHKCNFKIIYIKLYKYVPFFRSHGLVKVSTAVSNSNISDTGIKLTCTLLVTYSYKEILNNYFSILSVKYD